MFCNDRVNESTTCRKSSLAMESQRALSQSDDSCFGWLFQSWKRFQLSLNPAVSFRKRHSQNGESTGRRRISSTEASFSRVPSRRCSKLDILLRPLPSQDTELSENVRSLYWRWNAFTVIKRISRVRILNASGRFSPDIVLALNYWIIKQSISWTSL